MRESKLRVLAVVSVLLLAVGVVAAEGVWVSAEGTEHRVGPGAVFIGEGDGEVFDLSELEDGETRLFGSGEKQLTAVRDGDSVTLERPAVGDERALRVECELGRDVCRVITFGDDSESVAVSIRKHRTGHHGVMTIDEDVYAEGDGEATIVIKQFDHEGCDCGEDADTGCAGRKIKILGGPHHAGEMVVDVVTTGDGDPHENIWVHADGGLMNEGATRHDLSELYDGETRIFGIGAKQVTALREGDEVRISRDGTDDVEAVSLNCTIDRDSCHVLTWDDDPERVAVVVRISRTCIDGEGDCHDAGLLQLFMEEGGAGDVEVIELHGGEAGHVIVSDPDADSHTVRRIKIVREKDD